MERLKEEFIQRISNKLFPCVAAKDALTKRNIEIMTAGHLACPQYDENIIKFLYTFIKEFRKCEKGFHSAVVLFPLPFKMSEEEFEILLFERLKAFRILDAINFIYDSRVSQDPMSENYSFSLMEEAFFIIGLHPNSSRPARQFSCSAIVFNPHVQFERLRKSGTYDKMKAIVRKRDLEFSGSTNPMLTDFGTRSEIFQYSGRAHLVHDKCPFNIIP